MAKFQIPEYYRPGFDAIINLDNNEALALASVIKDIPVGASPRAFLNRLKKQLNIDQIDKIALTLTGLVGIRASEKTSDPETVQEIVESYVDVLDSELPKDKFDSLIDKLLLFFSNFSNLNSTYKAHSLLLSNDKIYRSSKIISDIRLVFNDDIQQANRHGVIIHKLKLRYQNDEEEKEFYMSLDTSDLKELKVQVERALEKDTIIKEDYQSVITFIDIE